MPKSMPKKNVTDLTQRPPRSPRVRLGGYVILPRILDKCRAVLAGKNGEYNYGCPTDQQFFTFAGVDPEALKAQVTAGKGDGELLEWIKADAKYQRSDAEVKMWSDWQEQRTPMDTESREFLHSEHVRIAPRREDIAGWFDLLDLDDYVSYGGQP